MKRGSAALTGGRIPWIVHVRQGDAVSRNYFTLAPMKTRPVVAMGCEAVQAVRPPAGGHAHGGTAGTAAPARPAGRSTGSTGSAGPRRRPRGPAGAGPAAWSTPRCRFQQERPWVHTLSPYHQVMSRSGSLPKQVGSPGRQHDVVGQHPPRTRPESAPVDGFDSSIVVLMPTASRSLLESVAARSATQLLLVSRVDVDALVAGLGQQRLGLLRVVGVDRGSLVVVGVVLGQEALLRRGHARSWRW